MFSVNPGEKYIVLIHNKNRKISFKEVICKSEFTNFQIPQMEIETTDDEYYPLYNVYKTKEAAIKDYTKSMKKSIKYLKEDIQKKQQEIIKNQEEIEKVQKMLDEFRTQYNIG